MSLKRQTSTSKRTGMYGPRKREDIAKIVSLKSVEEAENSVKTLKKMYKESKTPDEKVYIKRVMVLAANIAMQVSVNPRVSEKVRKRMEKVEDIYREAYRGLD